MTSILLNPLIPYIAAALGIVAALVLFLSVKREVHKTAQRERRHVEDMLQRLEEAGQPANSSPDPVFIPVAMRPGLNVTRRVHAMRMLRRGDDTAHIAAALGIPQREVELLIRVQGMVTKAVAAHAGK